MLLQMSKQSEALCNEINSVLIPAGLKWYFAQVSSAFEYSLAFDLRRHSLPERHATGSIHFLHTAVKFEQH